jgi:hypothetical protein
MSSSPLECKAHEGQACNLVDRFQQFKPYACPWCEIDRLNRLVDMLTRACERYDNEQAATHASADHSNEVQS